MSLKDDQFIANEYEGINKMITKNAIFIKFWYVSTFPDYNVTALPGWKEGVSGSISNTLNVGINRYISDERKKAAVEVLTFMTSKEIQKKVFIANNIYSGIGSLYNDEEVCSMIECQLAKDAQPFKAMTFDTKYYDINKYIEKYRNTVFDYLYRNKSISEVINTIDNMTKMYSLLINSDETVLGLVIIIFYSVITVLMISSILFMYIDKFKLEFKCLPNFYWLLSIVGSIIILNSVLTVFGDVTELKCKLRTIGIIIGFDISLFPFFFKLIIDFPEENKLSIWVIKHKCFFLIVILGMIIMANLILLYSPYEIKIILPTSGEIFQKCRKFKSFGKYLFPITLIFQTLYVLCMLFLIFIEWNIEETKYELKYVLSTIFIDILFTILYITMSIIRIDTFLLYNIGYSFLLIFFSISNFTFIYGIKIIYGIFRKKKKDGDFDENEFIKKNQEFNENLSTTFSVVSKKSSNHSYNSRSKKYSKDIGNILIDYHYRVSISKSNFKIDFNN